MNYMELNNNIDTQRIYKYRNKILKQTRNNETGNYSNLYTQLLSNDLTKRLKRIYGGNGDVSNISASFLLKFPNAKSSDISKNLALKEQITYVFKQQDSTGVVTTFELDTVAPNDGELCIYVNISWESSNGDAETHANALIKVIKNNTLLTNIFATLPVQSPFNIVQLDLSLDTIIVNAFVTSTIHSLITIYNNSVPSNTNIEIKTIGLYDHIGVKINSEDDNSYRRLRTNSVKTINIADIDPRYDVIIATLFNKDYKKLYTFIQSPTVFIQQTQGKNGDLLNTNVNGSITLNLNVNNFIASNQVDFITTMNKQTGGYTIVINVFSGSAVVKYKIIFDVTKTQEQINNVITVLNSDTGIQTLIDTSSTMNGVTSTKTIGTTVEQVNNVLTVTPAVINVKIDNLNKTIKFNTIGSYKNIAYKATGQTTFLTTTNKNVNLPVGFTSQIDVKLVNINDTDLTTVTTFTLDTISPVITLIGNNPQTINIGDSYVEFGANVIDNSGEALTAIITSTVNINKSGTYVTSYNAVDSSGNAAIQVQRTVKIIGLYQSFPGYTGFNRNLATYQSLLDNTAGVGYTGDTLLQNFYCVGTSYKFSISYKFNMKPFADGSYAGMHSIKFANNSYHAIGFFHGGYNSNIIFSANGYNDITVDNTNRRISDPFRFNTDFYLLETYNSATDQYTLQLNKSKVKADEVYYYTSTSYDSNLANPSSSRNSDGGSIITAIIGNLNGTKPMDGSVTDIKISHNVLTWDQAWPDTIPPVITLNDYADVYIHLGQTYTETATAMDVLDGSVSVNVTGTVDVNTLGNYVLLYNAKDKEGNNAIQLQRTVHVINTTYLSNYIAPSKVDVTLNTSQIGTNSFTYNAMNPISWGPNASIVEQMGVNIAMPWAAMFRYKFTGQSIFLQFNFHATSVSADQYNSASADSRFTDYQGLIGVNNILTNNMTHIAAIKTNGSFIVKLNYVTSLNKIGVTIFKNDGTIAANGISNTFYNNREGYTYTNHKFPFYIYNDRTNMVAGTITNIVLVQNSNFGYTEYTTAGY